MEDQKSVLRRFVLLFYFILVSSLKFLICIHVNSVSIIFQLVIINDLYFLFEIATNYLFFCRKICVLEILNERKPFETVLNFFFHYYSYFLKKKKALQ